jgi:SET family sugar efflux transporter-like MFS transporter
MRALSLIWTDPDLRIIAVLMVLIGALSCSFGPYAALLAVTVFGLGDAGYALLLAISTLLSVAAALFVGIRADQTLNRRRLSLVACGLAVAGTALMVVAPTWLSFVLAHGVLLPLSSTYFGQLFAQARIASLHHPTAARDGIMSTIRALFALPFVVVLPLWSLAFGRGAEVLSVYPVSLALALAMLGLTWWRWPRDSGAVAAGTDRPSGLSFRAALRELAHLPLALRVLALGAVNSGGTIYWALLPLVLVAGVGRGTADVALYAGLVAGLEVPFMLALPLILNRFRRTGLILAGTAIYALHLLGLPLLAASPWLWLMLLPAAMGNAVTLTLPIAYLQDLLASRPGTGAALMALQRLSGDIIAAGCFALGTALAGYGLVAVLAAGVTVAGALALHLGEPRR